MPLTRTEYWDTVHLHDFLDANKDTSFKWGERDCCLFAANAIESMTGVDIAEQFRGRYTTQLGAFKMIKKITGGSTAGDAVAYCAAQHGLEEYKMPFYAKRGDLVVIDNEGTLIGGVVHLNGRHVVSMSESGIMRLPITTVVRAWRV